MDTNVFASVFNATAKEHARFLPVFDWIMHGTGGRLVLGGTKYKKEIKPYLVILGEIERKGRLVSVEDAKVDAMAVEVKALAGNSPDFDDEHIVALVAVSKCCVVCTDDKRAFPFLKRKALYPRGVKPPKIYRSGRNARLCCDKHIVDVCRDRKKSGK